MSVYSSVSPSIHSLSMRFLLFRFMVSESISQLTVSERQITPWIGQKSVWLFWNCLMTPCWSEIVHILESNQHTQKHWDRYSDVLCLSAHSLCQLSLCTWGWSQSDNDFGIRFFFSGIWQSASKARSVMTWILLWSCYFSTDLWWCCLPLIKYMSAKKKKKIAVTGITFVQWYLHVVIHNITLTFVHKETMTFM